MAEHSGIICAKRTQDLEKGFQDAYCQRCWDESEDLQRAYLERSECFKENAVTEEVFDLLKSCKARFAFSGEGR